MVTATSDFDSTRQPAAMRTLAPPIANSRAPANKTGEAFRTHAQQGQEDADEEEARHVGNKH
jgi:hypothetical protein